MIARTAISRTVARSVRWIELLKADCQTIQRRFASHNAPTGPNAGRPVSGPGRPEPVSKNGNNTGECGDGAACAGSMCAFQPVMSS